MLRLGIIGAGQWGSSAHLASLRGHAQARVTAIANHTRASAERVAEAFEIPTVFASSAELIASSEVDAVLVTAPVVEHKALCLAALDARKPVLCEASLTLTLDDARELTAVARESELVHGYTLPRPYLYGGDRVAELLDSGALGTLQSGLVVSRGNPWLAAPPAVNWRIRADRVPPVLLGVTGGILLHLLGPVQSVSARLERLHKVENPDNLPLGPDYAGVQATLESGVELHVQAGMSPEATGSGVTLFGSEASLQWNWTRPGDVRIVLSDGTVRDESVSPTGDLGRDFPYARDFVQALLDGSEPAVTFEQGLRELEFIAACQRSSDEGRWIDVPT